MKLKWQQALFFLAIISLPTASFANIDIDHIVKKVKGFIGEELTRAYCMIKKDCHQRVIYVINTSSEPVTLSGCHFSANQVVASGADAFTARKNSKGHSCELTISKAGKELSRVVLSPYAHGIDFKKQEDTFCLTTHRVLKSWKKCPWLCGKYEVHGYIGACAVG